MCVCYYEFLVQVGSFFFNQLVPYLLNQTRYLFYIYNI